VSARDPLPLVAQAIKNGLKKSDDHRVTVALRLAEAKSRVEAGEDAAELQRYVPQYRAPWDAWLALNEIKLSEREVRFLLAVAASPDPHRMVADERARARDGMRRLRAARKGEAERRNVTPEPAPVDNDWLEVGPADAHQGAAHVEAEIIEPEAMIEAPAMDEPVDAAVDEPAPVAVAMPAKTDTVFAGDDALTSAIVAACLQVLPRGTLARLIARLCVAPFDLAAAADDLRDGLAAGSPEPDNDNDAADVA
jgi:hypothetical protein